ncbi:MAG: hypothetical protein K2J40_04675 [Ruminococcus sp.]|nr:hypothetical protein [Ruminococcus sp.]
MKKLLALLMACATITCAFASCGKTDKNGSVSDESSVSEASTEADAEAETTAEEETTEEETTEAETESDKTEASEDEEDETSAPEKTTHEYIEDADKTPFLGKWECEKLVVDGQEMTDLMGLPLYAVFQLEVKEDGTAVMAETMAELSDSEEAVTYTWGIVSDNEMEIVDPDDNVMLFVLKDDYLVGTEEGYDEQLYLAKVDEFTPFDLEAFMNDFTLEGMEESTDSTDSESETEAETTTAE